MENDGEPRQTLGDFFQDVKSQLGLGAGFKLVGSVGGADGDGQGVAAGALHKFLDIFGTGVGGVGSRDVDIVLNAGQGTQFCFDYNAVVMGVFYDLLGHGDILFKGERGTVDHNGGKSAVDTRFTGFEIRAVVQMECDGQVGIFNNRGLHQLDQVGVVCICAGAPWTPEE